MSTDDVFDDIKMAQLANERVKLLGAVAALVISVRAYGKTNAHMFLA
jgi:hypothetical protein